MISIILCIITGALVGFFLRKTAFIKYTGTLLSVVIMLLFFFLGVSVGSNEQVISNFAGIGLDAFILTIGGTLGSLLTIKWIYHKFFDRKDISQKNTNVCDQCNGPSTPNDNQ